MTTSSACALSEWTAAIHLADIHFTSRVAYADAYVLPTPDASATPSAVLVSPWLLCHSSSEPNRGVTTTQSTTVKDANAQPVQGRSSPASLKCLHAVDAARIEVVPLAWRCPTCGSVEAEQLFWRKPPKRQQLFSSAAPISTNAVSTLKNSVGAASMDAAGVAARHAAAARLLRLQGLSAAMKAKLERHRRRRERREEMRWRSLQVGTRCRQCYLCPRCGGHNIGVNASTGVSSPIPFTLSPLKARHGTLSVSALDIRLTKDMRYFAACPCCQWHSYQGFASMEQLIAYLDSVVGVDRAEVMRDWRTAQRSSNAALRSRLHENLLHESLCNDAVGDADRDVAMAHLVLKPTVSQAAWTAYKKQQQQKQQQQAAAMTTSDSASPRSASPSTSRGDLVALQDDSVEKPDAAKDRDCLPNLHPAVALEELRAEETARRARESADTQPACVPPGAVQAMRVMDLAQEALTYFTNVAETNTSSLHNATPAPVEESLTEVDVIARTQEAVLGLRAEAVDTRALTLQAWMQRYQPAAIVAQQRKAAAAAAAALDANMPHASPTRNTSATTGASPSALATLLSSLADKTPGKTSETPVKPVFATPSVTLKDAPLPASTPEPRVTFNNTNNAKDSSAVTPSAATTPAVSALYHTPTSAYLQSLLQREHDRPLGLPAYCVPRGRKEQLTGLVWRPSPLFSTVDKSSSNEDFVEMKGSRVPCTRVVVLDRPALSDGEVGRVYEHWVELLAKQAERQQENFSHDALPEHAKRKASMANKTDDDGVEGSDSDGEEDDLDNLLTAGRQRTTQPSDKPLKQHTDTATTTMAAAAAAASPSAVYRRKKTSLSLPLFLDGTGYGAAAGALPCWQYVGSARVHHTDGAFVEWRFRLVNLHPEHNLYVTKLCVVDIAVRNKDKRATQSTLRINSGTSASLKLQLSGTETSSVQLPAVLHPRCTPEERALLAQLQSTAPREEADSQRESSSPTSSLLAQPPPVLTTSLPPPLSSNQLPHLSELLVTLQMPADSVLRNASSDKTSSSSLYVALSTEVITPLPQVASLQPFVSKGSFSVDAAACSFEYNSVAYGVTVLLNSA